jgi:hypothetical protein
MGKVRAPENATTKSKSAKVVDKTTSNNVGRTQRKWSDVEVHAVLDYLKDTIRMNLDIEVSQMTNIKPFNLFLQSKCIKFPSYPFHDVSF